MRILILLLIIVSGALSSSSEEVRRFVDRVLREDDQYVSKLLEADRDHWWSVLIRLEEVQQGRGSAQEKASQLRNLENRLKKMKSRYAEDISFIIRILPGGLTQRHLKLMNTLFNRMVEVSNRVMDGSMTPIGFYDAIDGFMEAMGLEGDDAALIPLMRGVWGVWELAMERVYIIREKVESMTDLLNEALECTDPDRARELKQELRELQAEYPRFKEPIEKTIDKLKNVYSSSAWNYLVKTKKHYLK